MTKQNRLFAGLILVVAGLFGEQALDVVKNIDIDWGGPSTPDVVVVEPSQEYKDMVSKLVDIDFSSQHEEAISGYFAEVANVLEDDPGFVKNTGQFREYNVMAGQMHFSGSGLKDVYPNLGKMVDEAIIEAIGKENSSLTQDKRDSLIAVLRAVAWSVKQ